MGYRTHWTAPDRISVETMPADQVPGAVDLNETEDVLVLLDHGNQEGMVFVGKSEDWRNLAELILVRVDHYEKGLT